MPFGRLITAMVTPFDDQLEVDWHKTEKLIHYLIEQQRTDSIVINGTTGESPTLTESEKIALFEFAVREANGRCQIIAGTGDNDTKHTIQFSRKAEQAGVNGLLLVNPYYNRPSQEGLFQHFKAIASEVQLPIVLYNIPSRTAVNLSVETTLRLAQIPNIIATKECSTLDQMSQIIARAPEGFLVYSGDDMMTLPIMSIGGHGVISVASHVIGVEIRSMIEAFLQGSVSKAAQIHAQLYPIFTGLFNCPHPVPNPAPVKYALMCKGVDTGGVRLPLVKVTEEEAAFIKALFKI